jgi:hypothetical protein
MMFFYTSPFLVKIGSPIVYFHPFIHFLMLQLNNNYIFLDSKNSIIINGWNIY